MIDRQHLESIGVREDAPGRYVRDRVRTRNHRYAADDPKAELAGKLVSYDEELVPWPVVLPLASDPQSVEEARQKAVATHADFHHPELGWLRWGRKREVERPENTGANAMRYPTRRVEVAPTDDDAEAMPASAGTGKRSRQEGQ